VYNILPTLFFIFLSQQ